MGWDCDDLGLDGLAERMLEPEVQAKLAEWQDELYLQAAEDAERALTHGQEKRREVVSARAQQTGGQARVEREAALDELRGIERHHLLVSVVPGCYGHVGETRRGRASVAETAAVALHGSWAAERGGMARLYLQHEAEVAEALLDPRIGAALYLQAAEALDGIGDEPDGEAGRVDMADPWSWPDEPRRVERLLAHCNCPELPLEAWTAGSWDAMRACWEADRALREGR